MGLIVRLIISTLAVLVASKVISGVHVDTTTTAIVVAIVLGILNTFIRPIIQILALPITILTLGLFYFVINALMVYFASYLVDGFDVSGIIAALLFSFVVSIVQSILGIFLD
jgi:putative membrane protein